MNLAKAVLFFLLIAPPTMHSAHAESEVWSCRNTTHSLRVRLKDLKNGRAQLWIRSSDLPSRLEFQEDQNSLRSSFGFYIGHKPTLSNPSLRKNHLLGVPLKRVSKLVVQVDDEAMDDLAFIPYGSGSYDATLTLVQHNGERKTLALLCQAI